MSIEQSTGISGGYWGDTISPGMYFERKSSKRHLAGQSIYTQAGRVFNFRVREKNYVGQ